MSQIGWLWCLLGMSALVAAKPQVTVVGGGLAGLVAAITAAEQGASVRLLEAHAQLGGRARSTPGAYVANEGPHVFYADGTAWVWLRRRGLHRPYRLLPAAGLRGARFRVDGRLRALPPLDLVRLLARRGRAAPVDLDFRTWVARSHGDRVADLASAAAGVVTFTADPGSLSAAFVWSRLLRATNAAGGPRYVGGGWGGLVGRLAGHARHLGVQLETNARAVEMPSGPVVVATSLAAARGLLEEGLDTPAVSGHTALLDVAVRRRSGDMFLISDLDAAGWVEQFSLADPKLAPAGQALFQVHLPLRAEEPGPAAAARAEALLELAAPRWRDRVTWQQRSTAKGRSGALDLPGHTWRDRPAIIRGGGVFLAGDEVAAPGVLSEVSFNSAVTAATAAVHAGQPASTPVR